MPAVEGAFPRKLAPFSAKLKFLIATSGHLFSIPLAGHTLPSFVHPMEDVTMEKTRLELVRTDKTEALQRVLDNLELEARAVSKLALAMFDSLDHAAVGSSMDTDTAKTMLALLQEMTDGALERAYADEERIYGAGVPKAQGGTM